MLRAVCVVCECVVTSLFEAKEAVRRHRISAKRYVINSVLTYLWRAKAVLKLTVRVIPAQ